MICVVMDAQISSTCLYISPSFSRFLGWLSQLVPHIIDLFENFPVVKNHLSHCNYVRLKLHIIGKIFPGFIGDKATSSFKAGQGSNLDSHLSAGSRRAAADSYSSTANDATDTDWTWPTDTENLAWMTDYFDMHTYNGYKPFHQSSATFFFQDVGWPILDIHGNVTTWKQLPSLHDIAVAVWNLLPRATQVNIKAWAADYNAQSGQNIADAIYEVVKTALGTLGVPAFVVRVVIGVLVPRLVLWIVANINSLDVKDAEE
ncbi:hypothetical protein M501DRAFT_144428 [Patellaria atrata CBS 101060]|uniref:Uncharacterized protein n=1 Tax=Patellaria atrata CBS 101060 TaxID=1346257 RepID=A0A9P4VLT7_9PEZI|nr:hypothetical protein M501DRAFT_144428 [Patellaria atrata CBS 101060]